jgi:hypothetical protein
MVSKQQIKTGTAIALPTHGDQPVVLPGWVISKLVTYPAIDNANHDAGALLALIHTNDALTQMIPLRTNQKNHLLKNKLMDSSVRRKLKNGSGLPNCHRKETSVLSYLYPPCKRIKSCVLYFRHDFSNAL